MPLSFEQKFTVQHFECDPYNRMTPGAALRRIQEISSAQCDELGITNEVYTQHHCVFLLSRVSLHMFNMPGAGTKVRLQTRAYGMQRALFHRVTSLYGVADGSLLCETDTRWILVNTESRRILRRAPEGFPMPFMDTEVTEQHEMRMPKVEEVFRLADYTATYTMCDTNGHINNTQYADIVCNHLPLEKLQKSSPRRLLLTYHAEIPICNTFSLLGNVLDENTSYFVASEAEKKNFEALVEF